MSYFLAIFLWSFRTWNKHGSFSSHFSQQNVLEKYHLFASETPPILVVFSSGENTSIWGQKWAVPLFFRCFSLEIKYVFLPEIRNFLTHVQRPKMCHVLREFWRQNIAPSGKVLGQCFFWREKYSPKGRHVWTSCFAPKNPLVTAVRSGIGFGRRFGVWENKILPSHFFSVL
jgi:hypothetical protein